MSIRQEIKKHISEVKLENDEIYIHNYNIKFIDDGIKVKFEGVLTLKKFEKRVKK